ncbi:N-acetyl-gamma-glutamyl-phosphate reductase [Amycolatopsis anabasis]|uniref:N-acetyl-gamma-glutamyl-phosphate reductase n=1 Tax=Amycolatopsis anabasis TaxID=1840409 RepID=UPI00131E51C4|nr:N-acetyl-gamma-glutamyl-phosphate reductase [Amycolatopsis anabasis]
MGIPVGVVGVSGLVGGELLRLLAGHPEFTVEHVSASGERAREPGVPLGRLHPHLSVAHTLGRLPLRDADLGEIANRCATVFLATPPEVSVRLAPELLARGVELVVDASPAFRLRGREAHDRWYPGVERPAGELAESVYGLPELNRDRIPGARLIAVPGCFATAALLALAPLAGIGDTFESIVIDAKSGSSGSGNRLRVSGTHAMRANAVTPYAPVRHRHVAEIREVLLGRGLSTADGGLRLGMSTFGVDLVRGLSVAAHVAVRPPMAEVNLSAVVRRFYRGEPFVRIRDWKREAHPVPDPKVVAGSNFCDLAAFTDQESGRFVLLAALDNLVKGAAGQAVQCANLRHGVTEDAGLTALPLFPA